MTEFKASLDYTRTPSQKDTLFLPFVCPAKCRTDSTKSSIRYPEPFPYICVTAVCLWDRLYRIAGTLKAA